MLSDLFFDLCCLTDSVTKIIELASADTAVSDDLNACDVGGMDREYSFNAYAVGYAADGEGFGNAGTFTSDNCSLEILDS